MKKAEDRTFVTEFLCPPAECTLSAESYSKERNSQAWEVICRNGGEKKSRLSQIVHKFLW